MTKVPEGYTELELVGFTDKGSYTEGTSYVKNDLVHYGGAIYKCIVDDTVDVLPSNTSCWEVFILNHSNLDSIIAVDTEGKLGTKGEEVSAQQLVDKISRDTNKMVGATSETDGSIGLVPQPRAGDEDKALLGNGTWGKVDSIYKYKTEEEYNQAVANNEIPDGATVIKEWDEELSVIPVDSELSEESLNPLQNKVIAQKIAELNQSITELNNLLGGKLDVTKIANNLVTTEEGYALDARMGKALSDDVKSRLLQKTFICSYPIRSGAYYASNSKEGYIHFAPYYIARCPVEGNKTYKLLNGAYNGAVWSVFVKLDGNVVGDGIKHEQFVKEYVFTAPSEAVYIDITMYVSDGAPMMYEI